MGFLDTARDVERERLWLILYAVIPYADQETLGLIPGLRGALPSIEPIFWTDLEPTEFVRLGALVVVPYVDGEILKLLLDVEFMDIVENSGNDPILEALSWAWDMATSLGDRMAVWR